MVKMSHHTTGFENRIFVTRLPYEAIKYSGRGRPCKRQ